MNLESLVAKGIIDESTAEEVRRDMREHNRSVEASLEARGIDTDAVLEGESTDFGVPRRSVGDEKIPYEILNYVPEESAEHYKFVPLAVKDGVLEVGITNPDNIDALDALNFISSKIGMPFKVFLISERDFEKVLEMYEGLSGEVSDALTDLASEISEEVAEAAAAQPEKKKKAEEEKKAEKNIKEDAPVTKIVQTILRYAVEGGASDVHVEPTGDKIRVRFRVDGVLNTSLVLPARVHNAVVARVKILSSMRLDEKRKPQDGRFSETIADRKIDFRVSTFPTYFGEKVVMRILDTERGVRELEEMGLTGRNLQCVRDAIKRPYGMILISGPTGSGKTTTLYSMLNLVDRERKNVLSLEDPVEYNIAGMNQSQIRPEIGYTFASGLRTTLRQDPDVIMVGEIRDKETAQLAVQAALTGHLVLSTIHTNNAIGVIPRLIDMGVDPYLIAPTLILAIAQRLVRTLCPGTGKPVEMNESVKRMIEEQFSDLPDQYRNKLDLNKTLHEVESTADCPNGTRGRTAVYEVMQMEKDIERIILTNPIEQDIYTAARKRGMLSMKEDAIMKSFNKIIPFEEVNMLGKELLESGDETNAPAEPRSEAAASEEQAKPKPETSLASESESESESEA